MQERTAPTGERLEIRSGTIVVGPHNNQVQSFESLAVAAYWAHADHEAQPSSAGRDG
jgi:hypothetical protein